MSDEKKLRKFWIERYAGINDTYVLHTVQPAKTIIYIDEIIPVIEQSAYDAMKAERDALKAKLEAAIEALIKIKAFKNKLIFSYTLDENLAVTDAWSRTADVAEDALVRIDEIAKEKK